MGEYIGGLCVADKGREIRRLGSRSSECEGNGLDERGVSLASLVRNGRREREREDEEARWERRKVRDLR